MLPLAPTAPSLRRLTLASPNPRLPVPTLLPAPPWVSASLLPAPPWVSASLLPSSRQREGWPWRLATLMAICLMIRRRSRSAADPDLASEDLIDFSSPLFHLSSSSDPRDTCPDTSANRRRRGVWCRHVRARAPPGPRRGESRRGASWTPSFAALSTTSLPPGRKVLDDVLDAHLQGQPPILPVLPSK